MLETALTIPKSRAPKKPRKPTFMTVAEADRAAISAGFILVNGKRLEASAMLGKYIEQVGPLKVARSWYVFAASQVQDTMSRCDTALSKDPLPESEVQILEIKKGLITDMLNSAKGLVDSCKVDMATPPTSEPPRQPGFGPGVAVQVNLTTPPALPPAAAPAQ